MRFIFPNRVFQFVLSVMNENDSKTRKEGLSARLIPYEDMCCDSNMTIHILEKHFNIVIFTSNKHAVIQRLFTMRCRCLVFSIFVDHFNQIVDNDKNRVKSMQPHQQNHQIQTILPRIC